MKMNQYALQVVNPDVVNSETNMFTPLNKIGSFYIRPGLYEVNGATAIPYGVNFTLHSRGASSCKLL